MELENLEVIDEKSFESILKLVHDLTGITIAKNRKSMVLGRLRKRVKALKLDSYESYCKEVKSNAQEQVEFINLMTTNETYFYRTPRVWNFIIDKYLTSWVKQNPQKTFYAWSAASSSGEEPYTLAILLQDFKEKNPGFDFQITASDISTEMLDYCKKAKYQGRSIESFKKTKPELFKRHMKELADGVYEVADRIKSKVHFQKHNLFQAFLAQHKYDLVMLRNVLIYFTSEDQERVLSLIHPKLNENGFLIIGESESLTHINTAFSPEEPLVYKKKSNSVKRVA
jgi:chemotaxis protein methyltransferase CheR